MGDVDACSVQVLSKGSSPFEVHGIEIVPDQLDVLVIFEFRGYDALGYAMSFIGLVEEIENNGGYSLFLVFRRNSNQVEDTFLAVFSGTKQVDEPEWEKSALCFLQGPSKGWHGDSESDDPLILVQDDFDEVGVDKSYVFLFEIGDLFV